MNDNKESDNVSSRLSKLEAMVASLAEDVSNLTLSIRSISTPNWSTYIGFAGIILTIVGMVGGAIFVGYSESRKRTESDVNSLLMKALDLEYKRGVSETEIGSLSASVKKLDVDLQREMRDVNATTEAKLHAMDVRLQDEMKRTASVGTEDRTAIKEALREVRAYQDAMRAVNATQDERLKGLERQEFKN